MELLGFFSLTSFAALPIVLLIPTVMYLLESLALMRIGKKLGLKGSWRAFVPLLNCHLMGKMAEENDRRRYPEKKGKRWGRIALWLGILLLFSTTLFAVLLAVLALFTGYSGAEGNTPYIVAGSFGLVLIGVLAYLLFFSMVLVLCIVRWIILYKIYRVMADDHAVWMLVLSIFFGLATPVLLMVLAFCSKFPFMKAEEAVIVPHGASPLLGEGEEQEEQTPLTVPEGEPSQEPSEEQALPLEACEG